MQSKFRNIFYLSEKIIIWLSNFRLNSRTISLLLKVKKLFSLKSISRPIWKSLTLKSYSRIRLSISRSLSWFCPASLAYCSNRVVFRRLYLSICWKNSSCFSSADKTGSLALLRVDWPVWIASEGVSFVFTFKGLLLLSPCKFFVDYAPFRIFFVPKAWSLAVEVVLVII